MNHNIPLATPRSVGRSVGHKNYDGFGFAVAMVVADYRLIQGCVNISMPVARHGPAAFVAVCAPRLGAQVLLEATIDLTLDSLIIAVVLPREAGKLGLGLGDTPVLAQGGAGWNMHQMPNRN